MYEIENESRTFNHRVIKHTSTDEEISLGMPLNWYSIQEVYYNVVDSTPEYHTDTLNVEGATIDELRDELQLMLKSLDVEPINEIICNSCDDDEYIYESPDNGETVYRRQIGDYDADNREKIKSSEFNTNQSKGFTESEVRDWKRWSKSNQNNQ